MEQLVASGTAKKLLSNTLHLVPLLPLEEELGRQQLQKTHNTLLRILVDRI